MLNARFGRISDGLRSHLRPPPDLPPSSAGTNVYNTEQRFLGKLT